MYTPIQIGIPRTHESKVSYIEHTPSAALGEIVYCFWTFRAVIPLPDRFIYLVLPDGCIDIIFDVADEPEFDGALIMTPSTRAEPVDIRPDFSYAGIRLQPGAWAGEPVEIVGSAAFYDSLAAYNLREARRMLADSDDVLSRLHYIAEELKNHGIIRSSPFVAALLKKEQLSVEDLVITSGYSRRQLQRILKESVGYSPHDFIKVLRFQRALQSGKEAARQYADQSHFIRECKRVTGMTPSQLRTMYRLADSSNA